MITLFSISFDKTTDMIIDWLNFYRQKFNRINEINNYKKKIHIAPSYFQNNAVDNNDKAYFRKFSLYSNSNGYLNEIEITEQIDSHLRTEYFSLYSILCDSFNKKNVLGFPLNRKWSKLIVLRKAKQCGLDIPFSLVTNDKKEILRTFEKYPKLITKPIDDMDSFMLNKKLWIPYTSYITKDFVKSLPGKYIFPSLVQEYISKIYEIRTFYLDGRCYSMAIFSQNDIKTSVDFRRYNRKNPNRNVPYLLPQKIEDKIKLLMKELKLNTGSFDFIKSTDGRYVFLEVNPAGQYGMLSEKCNYKLEKKVAEWLCK
jgi:ATP-GRASP peptide maturase of grasp-with-spasm system